ncbi:MAG: co-chaperone GroES [Saprospiraceae bacterium]|jgi:co-chaperonin GroES (HSP10)|nr:co-chaperone GroES [Saprospiraceae bacterium]MBL0025341.1 co-chaperone GroES [Saprospiraceae bacterium]
MVIIHENKLKKVILTGDRVLVKPTKPEEKTNSGLYLPHGVYQQEKVLSGYVMKTGPGYAIPSPFEDEPWKSDEESVRYVPLQAKEGDLALFLVQQAIELKYNDEKYFIMPHDAILLIEREEDI